MKSKLNIHNLSVLFIIVLGLTSSNCNSSKEITSFEEVKAGKELDRAIEINLTDFFQIWMSNNPHSKLDQNCYELFKDEYFTYFGENELRGLNIKKKLYKIKNEILSNDFRNYKKVDRILIRQKFLNEIVPESDSSIYKESECSSSSSSPKFSYKLISNKIETTLKWKFRCDGKKLFENTYKGVFDLNKMEFEK